MKPDRQLGLHEDLVRDEEIALPTTKNFGVTFTVVFALIGAVTLYSGNRWGLAWMGAAAAVLLLTYFLPHILEPANRVWMRFAGLLHKIVSPVMLLLIYAVSILPAGLLMKLFGRDPLARKLDRNAASYWVKHGGSQSLRDQF